MSEEVQMLTSDLCMGMNAYEAVVQQLQNEFLLSWQSKPP